MYRCSRSSWPQNILTDFQGSMLKIFLYILFQALLSLFSSVTCCFPNAFLRLLTTSRRKARSGVNNTMLTTTILLQFEFDTILDHCTNAWFWLMKSSSLHFWYKGNLCFFYKKRMDGQNCRKPLLRQPSLQAVCSRPTVVESQLSITGRGNSSTKYSLNWLI